jgi:mandelate racemase
LIELPRLTIRRVRAVPVTVPMRYALGTSAATVREAPLLLVDLETEEGIVGRAYQFCYRPAAAPAIAGFLADILDATAGAALVPVNLWAALSKRYTLIGVQGVVRMAMSLVDVAAWDALATAAGVPLARLLGGEPRPIPAYNSNGLGLMPVEALAREADALVAGGFPGAKLRLGYPTLEEDLAAVRAVRCRLPDHVALMVDYNQALSAADGLRRARAGWRRDLLDRGADSARRLPGLRGHCRRRQDAGADWRELLAGLRHGEGARRRRLRLRDARPRADRGRQRVAAGRSLG